jgi:ABC-2 type transport system ATP-binding protein
MSDSSTPQTQQSAAMDVPAIRSDDLTKRFGRHTAVDGLTFEVHPGSVTGFLGPNGAGKTTTMRMILGLAEPTAGTATVLGRTYTELERTSQVGVLLDAAVFHPKRTARDHLRWVAAASHVDADRIDPVLDMVGLAGEADRRVGEFSLGMRQRLGLAGALLGEPQLLVLDEPANGLDPAGIRWMRQFLGSFARGGGAVFVSSHQLGEMSLLADEVIVIARGTLVTQTSIQQLTSGTVMSTRVRAPRSERLLAIINEQGLEVSVREDDAIIVHGAAPPQIGELAAADGLVLHELVGETYSLEDIFLELTGDE